MFGDMMNKLQGMKQQMDEIKNRLNNINVKGSAGGVITVIANGNRQIKNISISDEALKNDKEELEDLLFTAVNRALKEAEKVYEKEMQQAAGGLFPGMF